MRQIRNDVGPGNTLYVHLTYVPIPYGVNEQKSKPTQHSVKALQSQGLQPDILVCRSSIEMDEEIKRKLSLFSNVPPEAVISSPDLPSIYSLPLVFENQNFGDYICELLDLKPKLVEFNKVTNYSEWVKMAELFKPHHKSL